MKQVIPNYTTVYSTLIAFKTIYARLFYR